MKIKLLTLTSLDYYSFNVLLTEMLVSHTQVGKAAAVFANRAGIVSVFIENTLLFIKKDLVFSSCPALPYTSGTIAEKRLQHYYLVKLNINKYETIQNNSLYWF